MSRALIWCNFRLNLVRVTCAHCDKPWYAGHLCAEMFGRDSEERG